MVLKPNATQMPTAYISNTLCLLNHFPIFLSPIYYVHCFSSEQQGINRIQPVEARFYHALSSWCQNTLNLQFTPNCVFFYSNLPQVNRPEWTCQFSSFPLIHALQEPSCFPQSHSRVTFLLNNCHSKQNPYHRVHQTALPGQMDLGFELHHHKNGINYESVRDMYEGSVVPKWIEASDVHALWGSFSPWVGQIGISSD